MKIDLLNNIKIGVIGLMIFSCSTIKNVELGKMGKVLERSCWIHKIQKVNPNWIRIEEFIN